MRAASGLPTDLLTGAPNDSTPAVTTNHRRFSMGKSNASQDSKGLSHRCQKKRSPPLPSSSCAVRAAMQSKSMRGYTSGRLIRFRNSNWKLRPVGHEGLEHRCALERLPLGRPLLLRIRRGGECAPACRLNEHSAKMNLSRSKLRKARANLNQLRHERRLVRFAFWRKHSNPR